MRRKQQLAFLLAVIAVCLVCWGMFKINGDLGSPFVPQHGTGLLPDNRPEKCWALTLRADGTYAAIEAACKHPEKKP